MIEHKSNRATILENYYLLEAILRERGLRRVYNISREDCHSV